MNSNPDLGRLVFGSQNNIPDETKGINNAISCYKEAVQFSASFVKPLSVFNNIWLTAMNLVFLSG